MDFENHVIIAVDPIEFSKFVYNRQFKHISVAEDSLYTFYIWDYW
ncbi:hypothetical protein [Clostridium luticellarii]|jgi:hypothetical protein|uniref:Uncharacterized protein n=1 Tax=Clostridium luticellarii TaxID=1691940 RepID=A0A2T0BS05_9CLOT|nr:hypothetical protein [Clostridium luticellarii]PRR86639.1 hypothetical protein CLLU_04400 [Clostridium luticellarii]